MSKVRTCLWMARGGLEAARLYTSLLPDSSFEVVMAGAAPEEPLLIDLVLGGAPYRILTAPGGPEPNEAASISVVTADQAETDRLWDALLECGGREMACGWLTDRFGTAWQVVPRRLMELNTDPDPDRRARAFAAMREMVKIDIAALERAADGPNAVA